MMGEVSLQGLDLAKKIYESSKRRPVLVYGDPDVDGLIAMSLVCQFLHLQEVEYTYYVNKNREHGFTLKPSVLRGYLVIAVDFDISREIMRSLVEAGVTVLSFDHHTIGEKFVCERSSNGKDIGLVLNNQYPFEPDIDRYLSGAGVFYEAICEMYPDFKSTEREVLVGITLLSDSRPIENKKAREYLKTTYSANAEQGYIGYLVSMVADNTFGFGKPRLDRNFIDYTLSPTINSLLRYGELNAAIKYILGSGLSNKDTKKKQTELIARLKDTVDRLDLGNLLVLSVDANLAQDGEDLTNFVGILCSGVKGTGKSVLGFVHKDGVVLRASFRGQYDEVEYRGALEKAGFNAQGHPSAFGIKDFQPTEEMWYTLNRVVGEAEQGYKPNISCYEANNLAFVLLQKGYQIALDNCFVRDMFRSYIRYTGKNAKIVRTSYRSRNMTEEEVKAGVKAECKVGQIPQLYVRDEKGQPIPKYIEYSVDGKMVKSFGVTIQDGLIMPVLERGHVMLYLKEVIGGS